MNGNYLPPLAACLRRLGEYPASYDVNDATLTEIAKELDRARSLVRAALGNQRANRCGQHPSSPYDPTAPNGCLRCAHNARRQTRLGPEEFEPVDVARFIDQHGHDAAVAQFGPRAVTRALAFATRHPSTGQPSDGPAGTTQHEGDTA